jgi:two-component system, chemotaxis family, protein-glutamate methylesterase/glutaminase
MSAPALAIGLSGACQPIRVMVVDDSAVFRGLVSRWLEEETGIEVVACLHTGREAIDQQERTRPDVVLLDIDMPELDGLSALPLLLERDRHVAVIMASTISRLGAETSLRALSLGAADYIPKPQSSRYLATSLEFRRGLVTKVRQLGARRQQLAARLRGAEETPPYRANARPRTRGAADTESFALRPFSASAPQILLIGASTGGPQALDRMVADLCPVIDRAAVLITQHMPPTFTTILAEHLARASGRPASEATEGEPIVAGRLYVAPGGRHMRVERRARGPVIVLDDGPPVNFCRPSVDVLFSSAAAVWGPATVGVILTGMGCDGVHGAADIVASGGTIIAQDEATSVVWGMPGSVVHAGLCSAVLPLKRLAPRLGRLFAGDSA